MGLLKTVFGPGQEEVWAQLCMEIDGQLVRGSRRGNKVQAQVGDWTLTLDTFTESSGESSSTFTRMRAPFLNPDRFRFNIYRAGFGSNVAQFFGLRDIEVGDPHFDERFVVASSSPAKVRALLANQRIRELLHAQRRIGRFAIRIGEPAFHASRYPAGVDVLYFHVVGVIKDVELLKALFALFTEVLHELDQLDNGHFDEVSRDRCALLAPGGRITSAKVVIWDGGPPRVAAARRLGILQVPEAVPDLLAVSNDADLNLRVKAVWALGEIGDPAAVPALIPLLGDETPVGGWQVSSYAATALRRLGQGALVNALEAALEGCDAGIAHLQRHNAPGLSVALSQLLESPDPMRVARIAWIAGELGMVELLPHLRARWRTVQATAASSDLKQVAEAILRLECLTKLPRPAMSPAPPVHSLPRASQDAGE